MDIRSEEKLTGIFMPIWWLIPILVLHFRLPNAKNQISILIPLITPMLLYINNLRKDNLNRILSDKRSTFKILMTKHMYIGWVCSFLYGISLLIIYPMTTNFDGLPIVLISLYTILSRLAFILGSGGLMIFLWTIGKTMKNKLLKILTILTTWTMTTLVFYVVGMYQNCTLYLLGFTLPGSPAEGDMGAWYSLSTSLLNTFIPLFVTILISLFYIALSSYIIEKKIKL